MPRQNLSTFQKLFYAGPALVLALVGIAFYVYLPKFYAQELGVNLSILGYIILASRVFDAITDPIIGFVSDHSKFAFGRRRPFIVFATLPLALCMWLLFSPPQSLDPQWLPWWFGCGTFLFFLCWTVLSIPYEAWGPELASSYDERTKLFSFRDGALVLGTLLAAVIPTLLRLVTQDERLIFFDLAIGYGFLLVVLVAACIAYVPEIPPMQKSEQRFFEGIRRSLSNKPFLLLISSYAISGFGSALPATLIFFYVERVLGATETQAGEVLVGYFLLGFLFIPLWNRLGVALGKKAAWMWSVAINTGAFLGVLFLRHGDFTWYAGLVSLSAVGYGGTLILPSAMQADVIEFDELRSGERREGQFVGLWAIAKKLAAALGAGLALPILDWAGFDPSDKDSQNGTFALILLYAGVTCICNVIALIIVSFYPLSRQRMEQIEKELARS